MESKLVKNFAYLFTILSLISASSCITSKPPSANPSGPRTIVLDGKEYSEEVDGGFTSWYCKELIGFEDKVLIEVGFFPNFVTNTGKNGFVLYDGGFTGELAFYNREGLQHRWDWGSDYTFIIKADGTGLYYDFSSVPSGEKTKPSEICECHKR